MKSTIVNFLVHILSLLTTAEEHVAAVIHKAAASKIVQEAEAELKLAERAATQMLEHARDAFMAEIHRAEGVKAAPSVVPPAGVAALVTAAAATPPPPPQVGTPTLASPAA
jgi:3-polyprenyl-4-hydroxybenzoate decarboxylase